VSAVLAAYSITFLERDGGWYAEGRFKRFCPVQIGFGHTRSRALRNLKRCFQTWRH